MNNPADYLQKFINSVNKTSAAASVSPIVPILQRNEIAKPGDRNLITAVKAFKEKANTQDLPKTTHYIFVLDSSSSMAQGVRSTIEGFNSQRQDILKSEKDTGKTYVTFISFATQVMLKAKQVKPSKLDPLTTETYVPEGSTALHDAIGAAIEQALSLKNIYGKDTGVLISVLTDGEENVSRHISASALGEVIPMLEETKVFTFGILGPKKSLNEMAQVLKVKTGNMSDYDFSSVQGRAESITKFSGATASYASLRSMNLKTTDFLYDEGSSKK